MTECGASPGRGGYRESAEAAAVVQVCRERIAKLLGVADENRVVFALNATDALNLAIKGILKPGGGAHTVTSGVEHNSVLRPLVACRDDGHTVTMVGSDADGRVAASDVCNAMNDRTRLVVVSMASNVTGAIQPVGDIVRAAHRHGALVVVDAAQSAGHIPIRFDELGADVLVASGHKGLLGPTGTGVMVVRAGIETAIATIREGGTGTDSRSERQPSSMPAKFEAGTPNTAGIAGLSEGVAWLLDRGIEAVRAHETRLMERLLAGLIEGGCATGDRQAVRGAPLAAFCLHGPTTAADRVACFALTHASITPHELAAVLESRFGILTRAGLLCAPRVHAALGTDSQDGGVLRVSPGVFNTESDMDRLLAAMREVAATAWD